MLGSHKYLIVAALEMETPSLEQFAPIVHTGVGKLNAAIKLYEAIVFHKPDLIINYGTAGSVSDKSGLLKIDTFVQRDMDVRGLGVPRGVTPFTDEQLPKPNGIVLASGDSFVTDSVLHLEGLDIPVDLIDMEAFALHKVSEHHTVNFDCYKYVTDSTDKEASTDWKENVAKGASLFVEVLKKEYGHSLLLSEDQHSINPMLQGMKQAISGYHKDENDDWVAELACGHFQHVRHNPPWVNRPWVLTEKDRKSMVGHVLNCKKCNEGAPKDTCEQK